MSASGDPPQLGRKKSRKSEHHKSGGSNGGGTAKDPTGVLAIKKIPRPLSGFNLAGRPGILMDKDETTGLKSLTKKITRPMSTATINTDSEWNFVINTHKTEFVRFYANSMTVSLYSSYPHVVPADAADAQARATNWSTVALDRVPNVYFDPSVMGTSLVKGVRVTINGVPVQTNSLMEPHLLHYVRCARIFNSKPGPYIARQDQLTVDATVTRATIKKPHESSLQSFRSCQLGQSEAKQSAHLFGRNLAV